ncbi:lipoprotein BA_5634 family protein [Paenibacillus alvei]|uniref:Lipoprotein BA_5634 family protein n=1 Tax=Paenibacillus alvei TaxID=44250 RepID=A0ABT4EFE9_PAEAL|nr:lipoprotein BA_5634 family protein [Paenibacillus alvei]MCY9532345.1 lipoprotein BA_5634 family protein [Paenibacillus alvei]
MKKKLGIVATMILVLVMATGCSLFGPKANGLIMYGTDAQIKDALESTKNDVSKTDDFALKYDAKQADDRVIAISKSTAQGLFNNGLLQQVKDQDTTEVIAKLPEVTGDNAVIFAKTDTTVTELKGVKLAGQYGGDIVIGESRGFAQTIVLLDDGAWEKLNADKLGLTVAHFKKDPKNALVDLSKKLEKAQMVVIKK